MWRIFKKLLTMVYQPIIAKRISRDNMSMTELHLHIPAGVFHPRYFFSTKYLLSQLKALNYSHQTIFGIRCWQRAY
jgi:hypothetical protein